MSACWKDECWKDECELERRVLERRVRAGSTSAGKTSAGRHGGQGVRARRQAGRRDTQRAAHLEARAQSSAPRQRANAGRQARTRSTQRTWSRTHKIAPLASVRRPDADGDCGGAERALVCELRCERECVEKFGEGTWPLTYGQVRTGMCGGVWGGHVASDLWSGANGKWCRRDRRFMIRGGGMAYGGMAYGSMA
eukprot:365352-Chlamydomonas_euryale.AAC.5